MSIKEFSKHIEKGLKSPAYLLYSSEEYLLKEALYSLKKTVSPSEMDFLFHVFDAEAPEKSIDQIADVLYAVPFFGGRKIVVIENSQGLSDKELSVLKQYISKPSPDSVLAMLYLMGDRDRDVKKSHKEMLGSATSIALTLRNQELPAWMREKAKGMGFVISGDEVNYLLGVIGSDLGLLSSEIEKLAHMRTAEPSGSDITGLVEGSGSYNVFDLAKAIEEKSSYKAFKIYRCLEGLIEPQVMLGAINWHFTNKSRKDAAFLTKAIEILHETDIGIKSSGSYYPLEYMLVRLLAI